LFLGSFFVYFFEKDIIGTKFTSIPMALRWWMVTIATVWFGDMYPMTPYGKVIWSILVLLGPLIIALLSSITIMVFMETNELQKNTQRHMRWKMCPRCQSKNIKEANYCINCGEKIITQEILSL
jgi:voltage-gated potassium channel